MKKHKQTAPFGTSPEKGATKGKKLTRKQKKAAKRAAKKAQKELTLPIHKRPIVCPPR